MPASAAPMASGWTIGRTSMSLTVIRPRWMRPAGEGADGPDPGEHEGHHHERGAALLEPEQDAEHDRAEHDEAGRDQLAPAQLLVAHAVVARDDVPQRPLRPTA